MKRAIEHITATLMLIFVAVCVTSGMTACAAPASQTGQTPAEDKPAENRPAENSPVTQTPAPVRKAPAMSTPLPPERVKDDNAEADATKAVEADNPEPIRTCKTNADCTVKDVGNCCGYYPACVNVDAKVDPAAVKAQCRASGMAGVCGFPSISGCACVEGVCKSENTGSGPPPSIR